MEENKGIIFNLVHIHPLYRGYLKGNCAVCDKTNFSEESYTCANCNFFFCYQCSKRLSPEILQSIHSHSIVPTERNTWKCDLCRTIYLSGVSMYCSLCDFDVCCECFWDIKPKEIHVH